MSMFRDIALVVLVLIFVVPVVMAGTQSRYKKDKQQGSE